MSRAPSRPPASAVVRVAAAVAALVAAVALLHVARADLLLLLACPLLLAAAIPGDSTFAVRLVIAAAVVFCADVIVAWLTDLAGVAFTPPVTTAVILAPLVAAVMSGRVALRLGRVADLGDAIALGAGVVVFILLWLPGHADTAGQALARLLQTGEDNAGHLTLVQAIVSTQGDLLRSSTRLAGEMTAGQATYPPGFHLNVALLAMAFDNLFGSPSSARHVTVYAHSVVGLEAIWATTLVVAVRSVAAARSVATVTLAVVGTATVLFCIFGPPTGLEIFGAHAQTAALWIFTAQAIAATAPELEGRPLLRLSLVALGVVGVTWCWFLVAPLALVPLAAVLWRTREELRRRWPGTAAVVVAAGLFSLPPVYYSVRAGSADQLGASGGVLPVSRVLLGVLLVAAAGALLLPRRLPGFAARLTAGASLAVSVLEAAALRWYERRTPGGGSYYYEKMLFAVAVVALILAGAGIVALLSVRSPAWARPAWRRASIGVVCVGLLWLSTARLSPSNGGRALLALAAPTSADLAAMSYLVDSTPPPAGEQVLFWGGSLPVSDYYLSRFAAAVYLRNNEARFATLRANVLAQDDRALLRLVRALPAGIRLISGDSGLRQRLAASGFAPSDLARVDIVVIPALQQRGGPAQAATSYDFSAPALLPSLFGGDH